VREHSRMEPRCQPAVTRTRCGLFAAFVAALASFACGRGKIDAPSSQTPVFLISIDTLRSDHLPAYGYKGVATPNIDKLRADSILYERAYSHVPLTLPSHVTILTGMLPGDNGIRDNMGYRLAASVPTLPGVLKKNGYATGGAVSAFVLRRETGIARGFDFFDDATKATAGELVLGHIQRIGGETLHASQKWIDAQHDKPFFFFLHLYDPHSPYEPPEPFFSAWPNHYDGEIAYDDSVLGELLDELKRNGVYDKALIILLSDHGEGLNDHGEEEHGMFVYREALQVPLLVKLPKSRKAGAVVTAPVELVDVFPTILERTATAMPKAGRYPGQSLLSFLAPSAPSRQIYSETQYPRLHFGWSDLHSLIDGNAHFIRAPAPELFDLPSDPQEQKNLVQDDRRTYARMKAELEPFVTAAAAPKNIDREEAAKLAALGYVGSTVETKAGSELPDPKSKLGVFRDIRLAAGYHRKKDNEKALEVTSRLLADNPQLTDMWDLKAKILWEMGRGGDSVEAAKQGLRANAHSIALLFDVADLSLAQGDLDAAQKHAEAAVSIEPGHAHETLGRVALQRKDWTRAEAEAKLALESVVDPVPSYMILGEAEKNRGNLAAALGYLDQAEAKLKDRNPPTLQELHLNRGDVLARLDRAEEAEKEFRAEIADFPAEPKAYSSLVMLLATERRLDEATKLIFQMVSASPKPHTFVVVAETLKALGDDRGAQLWAYQGLQKFPRDPELRDLPGRLARANQLLPTAGK
jgi:arylsulfatase A-like enzyme/Tfp pilus assembly protein PilF